MAGPNIATKSPESDAQEDIPLQASPAHSTPVVGEHCVTDRPTRMSSPKYYGRSIMSHEASTNVLKASGQASTGEIIQINDVNVGGSLGLDSS